MNADIIPTFIAMNEMEVEESHPRIVTFLDKFLAVVEPGKARIISRSATSSERFGHVLRIVYKPIQSDAELGPDHIFMCWQTIDGPVSFLHSRFCDEANILRNIGSNIAHDIGFGDENRADGYAHISIDAEHAQTGLNQVDEYQELLNTIHRGLEISRRTRTDSESGNSDDYTAWCVLQELRRAGWTFEYKERE